MSKSDKLSSYQTGQGDGLGDLGDPAQPSTSGLGNSVHLNRRPGQTIVNIAPGDSRTETYRLSTFINFPEDSSVDERVLANHGWLSTGHGDRVQCFSCGATKQDWLAQDDARSARWHLHDCELVLGTDARNQPILPGPIHFTGTFESSISSISSEFTSSSTEIYAATSSSSYAESPSSLSSVTSSETSSNNRSTNRTSSIGMEGPLGDRLVHSLPMLTSGTSESSLPQLSQPRSMSSSLSSSTRSAYTEKNPRNAIALSNWATQLDTNFERRRLEQDYPCLHPVHPVMRDWQDRLRTFTSIWPSSRLHAAKVNFAKAGFFFRGEKDRAICWYCGGVLEEWKPNDEPFTRHARYFPRCEHLLRCRGADFVRSVIARFSNLPRSGVGSSQLEAQRRRQPDAPSPALPPRVPAGAPRAPSSTGEPLQSRSRSTLERKPSSGDRRSEPSGKTDAKRLTQQKPKRTRRNEERGPTSSAASSSDGEGRQAENDSSFSAQPRSSVRSWLSNEASEAQGSTSLESSSASSLCSGASCQRNNEGCLNVNEIQEMGFGREKIEEAIRSNDFTSVEQLVDFLLLHNEEEEMSFYTPDMYMAATLPMDPSTGGADPSVIMYRPPVGPSFDYTQIMLSRQFSTVAGIENAATGLRQGLSGTGEEEGSKCDIMVIKNAPKDTARECIREFFQNRSKMEDEDKERKGEKERKKRK